MISKLFWVMLTAVFTFGFIVLFENGTDRITSNNCQVEFQEMKAYFGTPPKKEAGRRATRFQLAASVRQTFFH